MIVPMARRPVGTVLYLWAEYWLNDERDTEMGKEDFLPWRIGEMLLSVDYRFNMGTLCKDLGDGEPVQTGVALLSTHSGALQSNDRA